MNLGWRASQAGLPQLRGGLLWLYRAAWCALAIGAVLASVFTTFQPTEPALLALRLIKSVVLVCVASILLHRRQRDPVAALLALAFLTWTVSSSFDFGTDAEFAQLLDRCRFLLFALALLLFPNGCWRPAWTRTVAAGSVTIFVIGVLETFHILPTRAFLPVAIFCILGAIGSLVARFRSSHDFALKQQLKWVALALIAGVGLILCARAGSALSLMPRMPIVWDALFQLGIIIVALGFLVALLRYRLFDAETVISRSASYAALTVALVATFGGTEAIIQNLGQLYLGMNIGSISGGMAAAVAAMLLQPLHERFSNWAEDRFQPDLAQLKREMPDLLARLSNSSTRLLGAAVLPRINAAIHASRSAFVIDNQVVGSCGLPLGAVRHWWRKLRRSGQSDDLFPVRLQLSQESAGPSAWLLLGPRPDGTLYGSEDLEAVRSTFPTLRHTLVSIVMREAFETAMERRERRLRLELNELRSKLAQVEAAVTKTGFNPRKSK